jgi:hypothetical protein
MAMVRKQVYITQEQDEELKRLSDKLGVSEAELIRRGIEQVANANALGAREQAWNRLLAFMKERAGLKVSQEPRTWTRDELYDND